MEWIIGVVIIGFLYYKFVLVKAGNLNFWKTIARHPDEFYEFIKNNQNFIVFETESSAGLRGKLPPGDWEGPFKLAVPSKKIVINFFGLLPAYKMEQEKFLKGIDD